MTFPMTTSRTQDFQETISSPSATFDEGLKFFAGRGMVNNTLTKIIRRLDEFGIDYAVIGAVALNQYGYRRFTEDIDLLLTREGLERFHREMVGLGYRPEDSQEMFRSIDENVRVEIITAGEYPGDGRAKPVRFPNPSEAISEIDGIKTITLEKLVELKLASGHECSASSQRSRRCAGTHKGEGADRRFRQQTRRLGPR
jgi:hypothetical protein